MPTQQGSGAMTFLLDQIGLGQKQENKQRRSELNKRMFEALVYV